MAKSTGLVSRSTLSTRSVRALPVILAGLLPAAGAGCGDNLAPVGGDSVPGGFAGVQAILVKNCVGCHVHDHSAFASYSEADFVNNGFGDQKYVVSGMPGSSLLYRKLRGAGFGGNMPLDQPAGLRSAELAVIADWITRLDIQPAVNMPPAVEAGDDVPVILPASASLDGTVSDDGLPAGSALVTTWTQKSGPGTVTFGDAGAVDTTASFSQEGTYVLELGASDGELMASDTLTVTAIVTTGNQAPVVLAGPDQSIAAAGMTSLAGQAFDDGLPDPPMRLDATWSQKSGPASVTFTDPAAFATTASFSASGTYELELTVSDGAFSSHDSLIVLVGGAPDIAPLVDAGADQAINVAGVAALAGIVSDSDGPAAPSVTWRAESGPGTVSFGDVSAAITTATFSLPGRYVLRLEASDGALSNSDIVTITAVPNALPTVSAGLGQTIALPATASLSGSASDPDGPGPVTVTWSKRSSSPSAAIVTFDDANALATTATFSHPGSYVLELVASDGAATRSATVTINVESAGFAAVKPTFANICSVCHLFQTMTEREFVTSGRLVIVGSAGDPFSSSIYYRLQGALGGPGPRTMPIGFTLDPAQVTAIFDWISGYTTP